MFRKITAEPALRRELILGDTASALGEENKARFSLAPQRARPPRPSGHTGGVQAERRAKAQPSHPEDGRCWGRLCLSTERETKGSSPRADPEACMLHASFLSRQPRKTRRKLRGRGGPGPALRRPGGAVFRRRHRKPFPKELSGYWLCRCFMNSYTSLFSRTF